MALPNPFGRRYQIIYEVGTERTINRAELLRVIEVDGQTLRRTLLAITETFGVQFMYVANAAGGMGRSKDSPGVIRISDWGILDKARFVAWYEAQGAAPEEQSE